MTDLLRTFIAIKIQPEKELIRIMTELRSTFEKEKINWVDPENLHLTLKFFGDTSMQQVEEIKTNLSLVAGEFNRFQISLKGLGFFTFDRQPRVIFTKTENQEPLKLLARRIEQSSINLGCETEMRNFKPHLTLGRVKFLNNKMQLIDFVNLHKEADIHTTEVSDIIYYQSILKTGGPVYKPIIKVILN